MPQRPNPLQALIGGLASGFGQSLSPRNQFLFQSMQQRKLEQEKKANEGQVKLYNDVMKTMKEMGLEGSPQWLDIAQKKLDLLVPGMNVPPPAFNLHNVPLVQGDFTGAIAQKQGRTRRLEEAQKVQGQISAARAKQRAREPQERQKTEKTLLLTEMRDLVKQFKVSRTTKLDAFGDPAPGAAVWTDENTTRFRNILNDLKNNYAQNVPSSFIPPELLRLLTRPVANGGLEQETGPLNLPFQPEIARQESLRPNISVGEITAVNPQTGERMIWNGQRWVPR